jgi:hypothetical protein
VKRIYWISGGVLLAALGCWFYYRWTTNERSAWAYIPDDYLLAVESTELQRPPEPIRSYQIKLTDLPILEEAQNGLQVLQQAVTDTALLRSFLDGKTITYSLHAENISLVNYLLYIPYSPKDQAFLNYINSLNTNEVRGLKHQTAKQSITDITIASTRQRFSFTQYDNYLILSKSSLLVENVAMKISKLLDVPEGSPPTPAEYATAQTKLWLNWPNLRTLGGRMMNRQSAAGALISLLPTNTAFRCQVNGVKKDLFVETTSPVKDANPYWQTLDGQQPASLSSQRFIPNGTAAFYQISLSDPIGWANRLIRYMRKNEPGLADQKAHWKSTYLINPDSVYYHINRELMLCRMESDELNEGGNLLLLKLNRPRAFLNWFEYEAGSVRQEEKLAKFEEVVAGRTIRQIALPELPSVWFGSVFQGFPKTYYTVVDGYAVFGSNVQVLRNYLADYKRGNVWANSAQSQEVFRSLKASPFTMVFNAGKSWFSVLTNLKNDWKGPVTHLEEPLKRLNFLSWQTDVRGGNVAHRLVWTKGRISADPGLLRKLFLQKNIPNPLGRPLQREPYVYKNAVTGTTDLVLQTTDNDLVPVAVGAKPTVKFRLSGPIVAPIQLMDYFGRGRDQMLIFTADHLYILHPTVKGYQLFASKGFSRLPSYQFSLFDQVPERKVQFSLMDADGRLYNVAKSNLQLTPAGQVRDVRQVQAPVNKVNLKGQEYLVMLEPGGRLNLVSAKGLSAPGFPINLSQSFDSPPFIETSDREADFSLRLVSADGELIRMNLEGKVLERQQMVKPSRETRFRLLLEESGKDWLVMQQTNENVTLFDKRLNTLFNIFPITAESQLRYFDFGAETKILSVTDGRGTMLYDLRGEKLIQSPVPSLYPLTVEFAESYQKLYLYGTDERGVRIMTSKIR